MGKISCFHFNALLLAGSVVSTSPAISQSVTSDPLAERGTVLAQPIVPSAFHGHWSVTLPKCGVAPGDPSQLSIAARLLWSSGTRGHIIRVVVEDADHAVVTVRADGDGGTFVAEKGLTLSDNGQTLTVRDQDDTESTRFHRCPGEVTGPGFIPHHAKPPR